MAEQSGDAATLITVRLRASFFQRLTWGIDDLEPFRTTLALAQRHGDDTLTAQAYVDLAQLAFMLWRFDELEKVIDGGLAFTQERDLDRHSAILLGYRAVPLRWRGEWQGAEAIASALLARSDLPLNAELAALAVLAMIGTCRGDPGAEGLYRRSWQLVDAKVAAPLGRTMTLNGIAQWAWHAGRSPSWLDVRAELRPLVGSRVAPWPRGLGALWLWRAGALDAVPDALPLPIERQLNGDWAGAAESWLQLRSPYMRAIALVDGDEPARREAFTILDSLGASATIERCRQMLEARGVRRIPRGARPTTRANALGLTGREAQVLALLDSGMSNADISRRLVRSEKTVKHHVSAILAKLGAATRQQAVHIARQRGLLAAAR